MTASVPATGTAGTAITAGNISSTLAASSGANATGTITFKVYAQTAAPTTCTTGGTTVGTATVNNGNTTYHLSAGYTRRPPATLVVRVLQRRHQQQRGELGLWHGGDVRFRNSGEPRPRQTLTATGPANGTEFTNISKTAISSTLTRSSGSNATGTITVKVFDPQTNAPTNCTTGGTTVGNRDCGERQRHLHKNRRPATRRRPPATFGGTRPTTATPTTSGDLDLRHRDVQDGSGPVKSLTASTKARAIQAESHVRDEAGATLILALLFMVVIGLIVGGLATWTSNSLTDTVAFAQVRSTQFALSSASQVAIQSIRYSPLLGTSPPLPPSPQTLNASPPTYCWGTSTTAMAGPN